MNLIEKLGLEKCKEIVDGAPAGAEKYHPENKYYVKDIDPKHLAKAEEYRHETWLVGHMSSCTHKYECDCDCIDGWEENSAWIEYIDVLIDLADLRTAIANHERADTCSDIKNHISPNTKVIEG